MQSQGNPADGPTSAQIGHRFGDLERLAAQNGIRDAEYEQLINVASRLREEWVQHRPESFFELSRSVQAAMNRHAAVAARQPLFMARPHDAQLDVLRSTARTKGIFAANRSGKCLVLDQKVLMADGTSRPAWMLRIGDRVLGYSLATRKATPCTIVGTSLTRKPSVTAVLKDGSTMSASEDHWFPVWDRSHKVLREKQLAECVQRGKQHPFGFMAPVDVEFDCSGAPLPVDPYVLGVLLRDGCLSTGSVKLSTADHEILFALRSVGLECTAAKSSRNPCYDYSVKGRRYRDALGRNRNVLVDELRSLGLIGTVSQTKFVPRQYLVAAREARLQVLSGLVDTDGAVKSKGTSIEFSTTSAQLAKDVQFLVRSLGGRAGIKARATKCQTGATCRSFRLHFSFPFPLPLRIERKRKRIGNGSPWRDQLLGFPKKMDRIGDRDCVHVEVDHPDHLFLLDNFVVTHNTDGAIQETCSYSTGQVPLVLQLSERRHGPKFGMGIVPTKGIGTKLLRRPDGRWAMPVPNDGWIASLDYPDSRDIIEEKLHRYLPAEMIAKWDKNDRIVTLTNGSTIGLKSVKSGRESFQGTSRHWILWDEEPTADVAHEGQARLIDTGGVQILAMTPLNGLTWVHDEIYMPGIEGLDPDVFVKSWSMYENPYVGREEIERYAKKFKDRPIELLIRVFGKFMGAGIPVFDLVWLTDEFRAAPAPLSVEGNLLIWKQPVPGHQYAFGCDPSGGTGNDNATICVIDRHTSEQVAEYASNTVDPRTLANVVADLGHRYNDAWGYVESNNHGHTTISHLREQGYSFLCPQQSLDAATRQFVQKIGWRTDPKTKPKMVHDLRHALRPDDPTETPLLIRSRECIREMMTYVRKDADAHSYGADGNKKDDRVVAAGLAVQADKVVGEVDPIAIEKKYDATAHRRVNVKADRSEDAGDRQDRPDHPYLGADVWG